MTESRAILHVDMDAFFASVEQHDHPHWQHQPLIVGGDSRRGVVAAASYEAREFGIRSAMPTREALQRCPSVIVAPPRMARYREVSATVFEVFQRFTPQVEGLSLDEAFLDVTASLQLFGAPPLIARAIKTEVRTQTGLTASVGIASNKLLAKIASDLGKPDGLFEIRREQVAETLDPMPVGRLPGIGPKTARRLEAVGIRTLAQLRRASEATLLPIAGRDAQRWRDRAAGLDDRPVVAEVGEQQISAEETFDIDLTDRDRLNGELTRLTDRVGRRLRAKALRCAQVTVKIRQADFSTVTRGHRFEPASDDTATVLGVARTLFEQWRSTHPDTAVRLLGVSAGHLAPATQMDLFAAATTPASSLVSPDQSRAGARIDPTLDQIRSRFGEQAVRRASNLDRGDKNDGFTDAHRR